MHKAGPPGSSEFREATLRKIRVPFIQRARLVHDGGEEDLFVIDLGLLGAFVERNEPLPVGEHVEIRIPMPGSEIPLSARCRVAWWHPAGAPLVTKSLPAGVGLQFLEISESDRERIRAHIVEYCRRDPKNRMFHRPPGLGTKEGVDR